MKSASRRPRVALLCTGLTRPTGTGVYARKLALHLPPLAPDLDFFVYAQSPFLVSMPAAWRQNPNLRAIACANGAAVRRIAGERLLLPRLLAHHRVDLLLALSLAAPPSLPCPLVVVVHDLGMFVCPQHLSPARRAYLRWAVRDSTARARRVIADSASVAGDLFERLGLAPESIEVVGLGVDPPPDLPLHPRHLLMLGADQPRKRADLLVAAYRQTTEATPLPDLVLCGQNPVYPLARRAAREDATPRGCIRRLGFVAETQWEDLLCGAALLVSPSDYEGYDLPPHEALARGVPVLLSDIPVHREIYGSDVHSFPAGDAAALAARLAQLFADGTPPPPPDAVVARWRARTWQTTAQRTLEVLRPLL